MLMNSLVSAVSSLRPRQQGYHDYIFGKNKIFIVVCFLLGDSPASEMYMPTFRNTLFHLPAYEDGTDRVFRNVGIYISDAWESPKRKHTTSAHYFTAALARSFVPNISS